MNYRAAMNPTAEEATLLKAIERAELEQFGTDQASLQRNADWYWLLPEHPGITISGLRAKGLISGQDPAIRLTEPGRAALKSAAAQRNALYHRFYQRFYPAARGSTAHTEFCKRVFGADLCQDGQVDMAGINQMLEALDLDAQQHVLDLGCGSGGIARYVAEHTGARVTGLDFADTAIAEARANNSDDHGNPEFIQGDINTLGFNPASFDAILCLDSLYWVDDLNRTLETLIGMLKPGGQLAIFMEHTLDSSTDRKSLTPPHTDLAIALEHRKIRYVAQDCSAQNVTFWWRIRRAAADLREAFEREGNGFIAASLLKQAELFLPDMEAGRTTRFFYHIRV